MRGHSTLAALLLLALSLSSTYAFSQGVARLSVGSGAAQAQQHALHVRRLHVRGGLHAVRMLGLEGLFVADAAGFVGKSVIIGGALAGGLHAVSGPDHFPALLPRCMGQKPWPAAKIGSLWGLGHAMSAMALGLGVFLLKEKTMQMNSLIGAVTFGADVAIGLSLCFIGVLSLLETKNRDLSTDAPHVVAEKQTWAMKMNMMMNGIFHGLSIDGIPTLMPVLGAGSLATASLFLASYGLGCVIAMTLATIFIGKSTEQIVQNTKFDIGKLIRGSAYGAIIIGILWTGRALLFPV